MRDACRKRARKDGLKMDRDNPRAVGRRDGVLQIRRAHLVGQGMEMVDLYEFSLDDEMHFRG